MLLFFCCDIHANTSWCDSVFSGKYVKFLDMMLPLGLFVIPDEICIWHFQINRPYHISATYPGFVWPIHHISSKHLLLQFSSLNWKIEKRQRSHWRSHYVHFIYSRAVRWSGGIRNEKKKNEAKLIGKSFWCFFFVCSFISFLHSLNWHFWFDVILDFRLCQICVE